MDYGALTTLRETLETYRQLIKSSSVNEHDIPPPPQALRQAADKLPSAEVIREIEALPNNILRLIVVREACQPVSLRHAALHSSLLKPPKYNNPRNKRNWYHALRHLVAKWEVLESENPNDRAVSTLRQLRESVEEALPRDRGSSLPLATLLITTDARLQKVEKLQERINEAISLLDKNRLAYAHDGLQEVVQSLWAQIRSEYPALSRLTKEEVKGPERDAVITRIDAAIAALRARHTSLIGLGFELPRLEVARGEGRERVDEEDEDDDAWEDVWVEPVTIDEIDEDAADTERATAKPKEESDGIESFLNGSTEKDDGGRDIDLPPVTDWVAAIKGDEADKINRLLLERLEEKAALQGNENEIAGTCGDGGRGRRMKRGRGHKNDKRTTTARQRLSAALGIKKRKKKSLLD